MSSSFRLALCQMKVSDSKEKSISKALDMIAEAAADKADLVVLPEMFNCPYDNNKFAQYAESYDGITVQAVAHAAKKNRVYIVAGSMPEKSNGRVYNTSFIFDRNGYTIGRYRKMHLFDISVKDGIAFKESETLTAGNAISVVDIGFCKIGVAICYDLRFPELFRLMALKGAKLIVVPGAFNMITGPAHWEQLLRVRAVDNQVYIAAASPARDEKAVYIAYGNSMAVDPWGTVIQKAEAEEEIVYADVDLEVLDRIRSELPLIKHRRIDVYKLEEKKAKAK